MPSPARFALEHPRQQGDGLAHPVVEGFDPLLVHEGCRDDDGDRQERHDEELPRRHREDRPHDEDVERGLPDRGEADVEEPLELVDVVVDGGQGAPRGPPLVPAEVEVLRVLVGVEAQVVLDGLGQAAEHHGRDVLARGLDDPHHGIGHCQPHELRVPRLDAEQLGDEGVGAADDDVDGRADEQLGHDVRELVDRRHGDGEHEADAVPAVARPQGGERSGGVVSACCTGVLASSSRRALRLASPHLWPRRRPPGCEETLVTVPSTVGTVVISGYGRGVQPTP